MKFRIVYLMLPLLLSCGDEAQAPDAYGIFEGRDVLVSSELAGKLVRLDVMEGQWLPADTVVGLVDTQQLHLRKRQLQSSIAAVMSRRQDLPAQQRVYDEQLANLRREQARFEKLLAEGAATQKQLDDLSGQIEVVESQKHAGLTVLATTNRGLSSETEPLLRQIEQIDDQIRRSVLRNPRAGQVLSVYAEAGEIASPGRPLYKLADTRELYLRAYATASQLASLKLGQQVTVHLDNGQGGLAARSGEISWISQQAEFTPKVIQTREERVSQVYAIKIRVANEDGLAKIGMPGDVSFSAPNP